MIGHVFGWMSKEYLAATSNADRCMGQEMKALDEHTAVLLTSDHGGHEKTHNTAGPEDRTIPIIFSGPGIPARVLDEPFSIIDIAPLSSICWDARRHENGLGGRFGCRRDRDGRCLAGGWELE